MDLLTQFLEKGQEKVENMVETNRDMYSRMNLYDVSKEHSFHSTSQEVIEQEKEPFTNDLDHFPLKSRIGKSDEEDEGILKYFMEDIVYSLPNYILYPISKLYTISSIKSLRLSSSDRC